MSPALPQAPEDMTPAWSRTHFAAASLEGWGVFECVGSANGPWQIQRLDDASDVPGAPQLDDDEAAWRRVLQGGQPHHVAALAFLRAHNPIEYESVMVFAEREEIVCAHVPGFGRGSTEQHPVVGDRPRA